jgi:hypothetical protein
VELNEICRIWNLAAVVKKSAICWSIKPCSPLKVDRRFGGTYRHQHSRWYLARLIWRWILRRYVPPKRRLTFKGLHCLKHVLSTCPLQFLPHFAVNHFLWHCTLNVNNLPNQSWPLNLIWSLNRFHHCAMRVSCNTSEKRRFNAHFLSSYFVRICEFYQWRLSALHSCNHIFRCCLDVIENALELVFAEDYTTT